MKVLHLIAPGPIAGAERVVLTGTRALRASGLDVSLMVLGDARAPEHADAFLRAVDGVPTRRLDVRGRLDLGALRQLRRELHGFRWAHAHGYKALAYVATGRPKGVRLAATHHGETSHTRTVRLYERVQSGLYTRADRVVAVSEAVRALLLDRGLPPAKVVVVNNPLSLPLRAPTPAAPLGDELRLLFLGRLAPEKGLDVLLEALPEVRAPVSLDVVGDGSERRKLEGRAWGRDVRFHGRVDDVRPHLLACHALVMPSRREGLPMALVEATASDRPVVASAVGGVPELVGDNGVLVPPEDPAALARAIDNVAAAQPTFQAAAARVGERVRRDFDPASWAAHTTALYRGARPR